MYVDEVREYPINAIQPAARRFGRLWSHITCDGDCEALHAFAARLGLRRAYAQHMEHPDHFHHHYDCIPSKRALAVRLGAVEISARELYLVFHPRGGDGD